MKIGMPEAIRAAQEQSVADPNTVELNLDAPFPLVAVPPVEALAAFETAVRSEPTGKSNSAVVASRMAAITAFFDAIVVPEHQDRFRAGLSSSDPASMIHSATLLQLFPAVFDLYRDPNAVPTPPASPSGATQETTGPLSAESPDASTTVEFD